MPSGKESADLGIEMLVLDDGWFGKRNDDNTSRGDWQVNEINWMYHGRADSEDQRNGH